MTKKNEFELEKKEFERTGDVEQKNSLNDRRAGAIWEGLTQKGEPKLSIVLNDTRYFALKKLKKHEKQPDWVVFSQ